ncbi:MAG: exodeoxyribonuclease III [Candidatus Micrarchaeia archaeon]
MKIISWNVNGIRSAISKGLFDFIKKENPDIMLFQEVRSSNFTMPAMLVGYHVFLNPAVRKGYSGTMVISKEIPSSVINGMGIEKFDSEGRVQALQFSDFILINVYFPNAQPGLARLDYKLEFDKEFTYFAKNLRKSKPLLIGGDMNVAHEEIDISDPKANEGKAGFSTEERKWMDLFLKEGFVDVFRHFHKEPGFYTWWSYFSNSRARNKGWRIDYFISSTDLIKRIKNCTILSQVYGSDHAPINVEMF